MPEVWRQHRRELYKPDDQEVAGNDFTRLQKEQGILKSEIEQAICYVQNIKAPGVDGICAEIRNIKAMGGL